VATIEWDHLFPKAWYPATTQQHVEKWTIPSCRTCNGEYGKVEERLLQKFAMCLDPDDPDTADIVQRGMRALSPSSGRTARDQAMRHARRDRVRKQLIPVGDIQLKSVLPNFGPSDVPVGETAGIPVSKSDLERFGMKLVRGATYLESGVYIDDSFEIGVYVVANEAAADFIALVRQYGKVLAREPGIEIVRAEVPEDRVSSLYEITIWKQLKLYATVNQRNDT
jgi:hypothetical protein